MSRTFYGCGHRANWDVRPTPTDSITDFDCQISLDSEQIDYHTHIHLLAHGDCVLW